MPVASASVCAPASRSRATVAGPRRSRLRWRSPCSSKACPAAKISRASAGCRRTCSPTRKNVARALAAVSAACYDGAVALQAREARALEGAPGRVGGDLVSGLLRRRGWLLATGLALAGWPFQVAALALAPVAVVQPTLALGLVLLL